MSKLKFLGRGSAFNTKEGNTAAYVKENGTLLLIDCGESIFKTIKESDLLHDVTDVYVLITHMHSDHVGSLSSLLFYCYYIKKIKAKVYFHDIQNLEMLLIRNDNIPNETYIPMGILEKRIDKLGLSFDSNPVIHKSIYAYDSGIVSREWEPNNIFECYGYFLNFDDGVNIYYSGDSNHLELDIILLIDKGYIIYQDTCFDIHDGNPHMSLGKLIEKVPAKYRDKVYIMHIDCDELIIKAKEAGFNIVEIEAEDQFITNARKLYNIWTYVRYFNDGFNDRLKTCKTPTDYYRALLVYHPCLETPYKIGEKFDPQNYIDYGIENISSEDMDNFVQKYKEFAFDKIADIMKYRVNNNTGLATGLELNHRLFKEWIK